MTTNSDRFVEHLKASEDTRWLVARWLSSRGHLVSIPPLRIRPSPDQWRDYVDEGDLHIVSTVEAKRLSHEFTCRADWPYGDEFIVCGKDAFDRALPKPLAFMVLSWTQTHAALVKASTHARWHTETRHDKRYGPDYAQEFYFAPMDCVEWVEL